MAPRRRKAIAKAKPATAADLTRLPESLIIDCVLPFAGYKDSLFLNHALKCRFSKHHENGWERAMEQNRRAAFGFTRAEAAECFPDKTPDSLDLELLASMLIIAQRKDRTSPEVQALGHLLALGIRGEAHKLMAVAMGIYVDTGRLVQNVDFSIDALQMVLDTGIDCDAIFTYEPPARYGEPVTLHAPALYVAAGIASPDKRRKVMRMLLDAGAEPDALTTHTCFQITESPGLDPVLLHTNSLHVAVQKQHLDAAIMLLAAARDAKEMVTRLNFVAESRHSYKRVTPLESAVSLASWPIVKVLLDAGGPAAIRDRKGQNILHTCVRRHGPSLIAAGANVRSKMVSDPPASIFQFRETQNHPSRT